MNRKRECVSDVTQLHAELKNTLYLPNDIRQEIVEYVEFHIRLYDMVDARDFQGGWFHAIVLKIHPHKIYAHFWGWATQYDEEIEIGSQRIRPFSTESKPYQSCPTHHCVQRHGTIFPSFRNLEIGLLIERRGISMDVATEAWETLCRRSIQMNKCPTSSRLFEIADKASTPSGQMTTTSRPAGEDRTYSDDEGRVISVCIDPKGRV